MKRLLTLTALSLLAHATAAIPARFSLEVGQSVNLTTLGTSKTATFVSSDPSIIQVNGQTATALRLTPDGQAVTITATEGRTVTQAAVTSHGIEYGVGAGTTLRSGQPPANARILIVRARMVNGAAPDRIDSAYAYGNAQLNPAKLAPLTGLVKIGGMLIGQFSLDQGQEPWDVLMRSGNITRRFQVPEQSLRDVDPTSSIQGTVRGNTLTLTGSAPVESSLAVRVTGNARLMSLPPISQPGRTRLPATVTLNVPGGQKASVEVRIYNAPVLDPTRALPATFTWTQHTVATVR